MPRLVEDLVPERLPLAVVVKVLQNLLAEEVSIRDLRTIIETLAEYAPQTQDAGILTARVRVALGRLIVQQINNLQSEMPVSALDPALEQLLLKSQQGDGQGLGLEPQLAERLHSKLGEFCQQQEIKGEPAILLAPGVMRAGLARWLRGSLPQLKVLAYDEVPAECQIRVVSSISG
jgi:flagellar biosynthesis protein FlhA